MYLATLLKALNFVLTFLHTLLMWSSNVNLLSILKSNPLMPGGNKKVTKLKD